MRARSSASRMRSWPSLARRMTTRVTAFLGSLAVAPERALRLVAGFFALRFAMVAGIVLQSGEKKRRREAVASHRIPNERLSRAGAQCAARLQDGYFSASLWPASRLSKLRIVFRTNE